MALPIYTHIPNLKVLAKIFFKLSRPKGNLCSGGVTVLNPKYPRLSSGDTMTWHKMVMYTVLLTFVTTKCQKYHNLSMMDCFIFKCKSVDMKECFIFKCKSVDMTRSGQYCPNCGPNQLITKVFHCHYIMCYKWMIG